jgi:hypothetical protein
MTKQINSMAKIGGLWYVLLLLTALLAVLPGCLNLAITDATGPAAPTPGGESFAEFMDVPYPSVMVLEKRNTYTYERRGMQAGVVTVVGNLSSDEIGAYYDLHLPSHGWSPLAEAQSSKLVATWTKGNKVLTVISTPITLSLGSDTRLELWVAPPHTKGDLGQRIVYDDTSPRRAPLVETTPIRSGSGSSTSRSSGAYQEEDI